MTPGSSRAALFFLAALLMHDPLIPLMGTAIPAHGLLALGALVLCLRIASDGMGQRVLPWIGGRAGLLAILPLALLGTLYSLLDRGDLSIQAQFLSSFVLLPLMWYALSALARSPGSTRRINLLLMLYVGSELLIMSLQASYFLLGIGIAPSEVYEFMISGSQYNQNNLAAIVLTLSVFFNATSQDLPRWQRVLFNLIVFTILAITFSRLAMLLYIFDRLRKLSWRDGGTIAIIAAILVGAGVGLATVDYTGNETIDASLYKAKSLATIAEVGLEADSSTSSRSESYFNFIDKFGRLGLGTAQILKYQEFTWDALFFDEALYVNPHSMVVEIGYWMGWPGLICLALFLLLVYGRSAQGSWVTRAMVVVAVLLISSIPSSAIPLPSLWLGLLLMGLLGDFSPASRAAIPPRVPEVSHAH